MFIQVNGAGLIATYRWLELKQNAGASAANANTTSRILPGAQGLLCHSSDVSQCTKTRLSSSHCVVSSWRFSGGML